MVPFFSVFSEFMVSEFAGDPKISVEMILVKKKCTKIVAFEAKKPFFVFVS